MDRLILKCEVIHMSRFISVKRIFFIAVSNFLGFMGILLLHFITFQNEDEKRRQVFGFVLLFGIIFELSALIISANNLTSFLYLRKDPGKWSV